MKTKIEHEFVDAVPDSLKDGVVYISIKYATATHKCCCGCGSEIVTPLSPTDWKLTFDGETITLYPSIGNWNLKCRSHYWIRNNQIIGAEEWSDEDVAAGRLYDRQNKEKHYGEKADSNKDPGRKHKKSDKNKPKLLNSVKKWFD